MLRIASGPWKPGRIDDLSPQGFRIGWVPQCAIGRRLWVRLPGLEAVPATVRWKSNGGAGCEFDRPLHAIIVEHVARRA